MIELNEDLHDKPLDFDQKTPQESVFIGSATTKDSYDRVAVENFGSEIMANMGWKKGFGIGRQKNEEVCEPIEYVARQHRLGLGAQALSKEEVKKTGEDRRKLTVTENYGPSSVGKNFKRLGENLTSR